MYANQDREGYYLDGLAFGRAIMDDEIQHHHGVFDYHSHQFSLIISSPFGHNPIMFGSVLNLQSSPEQQAHWLALLEAGKIIGTYAQTELAHGTFVRGIETTATLDLETDEFIVHSPTLTSTKYWPSALGFSASHAIVMARCIIRGADHGMQPFMVQLRSLDDYKPMPGIELNDVGLKMGLNSSDMGYATFDKVRIPRTNLIMGNVQVLRDGTFIGGKHQKLVYATMMSTRDRIIHCVTYRFAQAVVIATRYSTVREQGVGMSPSSTAVEWPILAYKSQHYRLLLLMAQVTFHAHHLLTTAQSAEGGDLAYADAWNMYMRPLVYAARAHIELFVLGAFIAHTTPTNPSPVLPVLQSLRSLFALTAIENPASLGAIHFLEDGYISHSQVETGRGLVDEVLGKLIPEVVALGDAWGFSDASLGCWDGDVYGRVMGWTRQLPLNVKVRGEGGVYRKGWEGVVGSMLKGRL